MAIRQYVEQPLHPDPLSEAAFIAGHYWVYAVQRDGSALEYQVEHPQWRVAEAEKVELVGEVERLYDAEFAPSLSEEPAWAVLANESEVLVWRGVRFGDE